MVSKPSHNFVIYLSIMTALFIVSFFSNSLRIFSSDQVATVSQIGASISETPTNKLAYELREYSKELSAKEKALKQRELELEIEAERVKNYTRNLLIGVISLSLITLIFTNIYMYYRSKKQFSSSVISKEFQYSKTYIPRMKYQVNIKNDN